MQFVVHQPEELVGIGGVGADEVDVATDVGAHQSKIARGGQDVGQCPTVVQMQPDRALRPCFASVEGDEPEGKWTFGDDCHDSAIVSGPPRERDAWGKPTSRP